MGTLAEWIAQTVIIVVVCALVYAALQDFTYAAKDKRARDSKRRWWDG